MFKKVLVVVVMLISVLIFLGSIAGIIGVWVINTPLTEDILNIFVPIDRAYIRFDEGVAKIDSRLDQSRDKLTNVEQTIETLGDTVEENTIILNAIQTQLDIELEPAVNNVRQSIIGIRESALAIQNTLETINSIPFVSLPLPEESRLENMATGIDELAEASQEFRNEIQTQKSGAVTDAVERLTKPVNKLDSGLERIQTNTNQLDQRLNEIEAETDHLQERIPVWVDGLSVIITLVLLWITLSQVSLFIYAYYYFSGRNLLNSINTRGKQL